MARYRRKKPTRARTNTTNTKMRGGFAVPGKAFRRSGDINKQTSALVKRASRAGTVGAGARVARTLGRLAAEKVIVDIAGTAYQKIRSQSEAYRSDQTTNEVGEISERSTRFSNSGTGRQGMTHKTFLKLGQEPVAALKRAKMNNGSTKGTIYDSIVIDKDGANRLGQVVKTGFNQKTFVAWDKAAAWTYNDLYSLFGVAGYSPTIFRDQRAYGGTMYCGQKMTISNINKYLAQKVKIHWCIFDNNINTPVDTLNTCWYADISAVGINPTEGRGPSLLQQTDVDTSAQRWKVQLDPVLGKMQASQNFNNSFEIVKTFSKTLAAGDVWEFDYKHECGSGIRLDKLAAGLFSASLFDLNKPAFLYPIIEVVGKTCDAYLSDNPDLRYTGTAPGTLLFEFKKYHETVQASVNAAFVALNPGEGGFTRFDYLVRIFTQPSASDPGASVRFFVENDDIITPADPAAPDKYIIPVMSDETERYSQVN